MRRYPERYTDAFVPFLTDERLLAQVGKQASADLWLAQREDAKQRLAGLWAFSRQRLGGGFTAQHVSEAPYDALTSAWKPKYGISSIAWIDPQLMRRVQETLKAELPPELQDKLVWLKPETNHVTIVGFKTQGSPLSHETVERQQALSDRLIPELIQQPLTFSAEGIGMMRRNQCAIAWPMR